MNAGPLVSKFNRKHLRLELIVYLLGALSSVSMYVTDSKPSLVAKLMAVGLAFPVALCIWAFCLKKITLVGNELEVKRVCLPFLKRFYRLAEFDSYVVEEQNNDETLHLLNQGRRLLSLSSKTYENYAELKQALSVVGLKEWGADANRAVDSVFKKSELVGVFLMLLFVMVGVAVPVSEYFEDGQVTLISAILGLVCGLPFLAGFLYGLSHCKRLSVWRGHLEVQSLLCPWKTNYYALDDFDDALEVFTQLQGETRKALWLVREGKVAVSISQPFYANYDVLEHAIGIAPSRSVSMNLFKRLKYHFGKPIDI